MAASLVTKIQLIDEMSDKLEKLGSASDKAANKIESMGDSAQSAFNTMEGAADRGVSSVDGVATSLDKMGTSSSNAQRQADGFSSATENMENAAAGAAEATGSATSKIDEMGDKAQETKDDVDGLGDETKKTSMSMEDLAGTLQSVMGALGITAAVKEVTNALKEASEASAEFETSLAQLQTIAGEDSMGTLSSQLLELSNTSGQAATSLTETAYSAISAGQSVEDAASAAEAASKLATAGFTDTNSALSVLTTAANSYGDSAGSLMDISDSLITVQNLGVTTVAQLAQQMGRAIATASAYNVSLSNLETAYISTTKAGIGTAESTTYISGMLNELGKSSSDVAGVLQDETGKSFGELMNEGYNLADVLGIIYDSVDDNAEAMMNLWGSAEAGKAANAIISQGLGTFKNNLDAVTDSAGATEDAYQIMADTTEYAHNKMQNSMKNLSSTIGGSMNPSLEKMYNAISNVANSATDFLQQHPKVASAISSLAAGFVAGATALAGIVTVTKVVIPALAALKVAVDASTGGITLLISAVVAAGAAIVAFSAQNEEAIDPMDQLTYATQAQQEKLESLQAEYEEACEKYGETSDEASRLRYQIDDLNDSIEQNGQTVQEMVDHADKVISEYNEMQDSFKEQKDSINDNELETLALVAKLDDLANSTDNTAGKQEAMKTILDELNGSVEGLNMTYSDLTKNQDASIEKIKDLAKAQADQQMAEEQANEYVEALKQQSELTQELTKVSDELTAAENAQADAQDRYNAAAEIAQQDTLYTGMYVDPDTTELERATADVEAMRQKQEELQSQLDDVNNTIADTEQAWKDQQAAQEDAAQSAATGSQNTISYQEAVALAVENVQQEMYDLSEAYSEAYESAKSSFDGMFGIFDEATMKSDDYKNATVKNAQEALDSQLAYWNSYAENIEKLKAVSAEDLGVTQQQYNALMSQLQDGSEQSAGLAASITSNLESGNTEAVAKLAETAGNVEEKKSEIADSVADWQTDFYDTMDDLVDKMDQTVEDLDLSEGATESARTTISAYASEIEAGGQDAVNAAESIVKQVAAVFASSSNITVSDSNSLIGQQVSKLQKNASGTTNAADVFIAGEEGPELVVGQKGAEVFPTSETDKIIDAVNDHNGELPLSQASVTPITEPDTTNAADVFGADQNMFALSNTQIGTPDLSTYDSLSDLAAQAAQERANAQTDISNILTDQSVGQSMVDSSEGTDFGVSLGSGAKDTTADEGGGDSEESGTSEKKITLEINGSGAIDIKGTTEEEVMDILVNNVKPVLMDILRSEIYEEGQYQYDF